MNAEALMNMIVEDADKFFLEHPKGINYSQFKACIVLSFLFPISYGE